jgi:hypothetical protein
VPVQERNEACAVRPDRPYFREGGMASNIPLYNSPPSPDNLHCTPPDTVLHSTPNQKHDRAGIKPNIIVKINKIKLLL